MKFNLSISKDSNDKVNIRVKCKTSRIAFVELNLSLEEYAKVITGSSETEVNGSVRDLSKVGKIRLREVRTATIHLSEYDYKKENAQKYLLENCQEEGWEINDYLGSQNSIVCVGGDVYKINYSVEKWVEEDNG